MVCVQPRAWCNSSLWDSSELTDCSFICSANAETRSSPAYGAWRLGTTRFHIDIFFQVPGYTFSSFGCFGDEKYGRVFDLKTVPHEMTPQVSSIIWMADLCLLVSCFRLY